MEFSFVFIAVCDLYSMPYAIDLNFTHLATANLVDIAQVPLGVRDSIASAPKPQKLLSLFCVHAMKVIFQQL